MEWRSKMSDLNDYSGPFNPDLSFEDFSKEFLIKIIDEYQHAWVTLADSWMYAVKSRFGITEAQYVEVEGWMKVYQRLIPYWGKHLANVENPEQADLEDCIKLSQFGLDGAFGFIPIIWDFKSKNHAIMTMTRCPALEWLETREPERIQWMCWAVEPPVLAVALPNPNMKVTPLKLPPRKGPDDIACQWEIQLVQGVDEVVHKE